MWFVIGQKMIDPYEKRVILERCGNGKPYLSLRRNMQFFIDLGQTEGRDGPGGYTVFWIGDTFVWTESDTESDFIQVWEDENGNG